MRSPLATETPIRRRDWLKAAAAAAAVSPGLAAAATANSLGKNIRLGVDAGPYGSLAVDEAARRIQEGGFTGVLCNFQFADARFDPLNPDWQIAGKIVAAFERRGIRIASLYGYYNVISPNPAYRARGEARMLAMLANWKKLGCPVVATETGTFNPKSEWAEHPDNATEAGYQQCRAALERLVRAAEKSGAVVAIEAYWRNVIGTIERAERLLREISSPALKLVMDPCNYFAKEDLARIRPMLEDMFRRLGDRAVVAHAKDVRATADGTDTPAAGRGVLDYPLFLRLLQGLNRPIDLILEHVTMDDVPRARQYVLSKAP